MSTVDCTTIPNEGPLEIDEVSDGQRSRNFLGHVNGIVATYGQKRRNDVGVFEKNGEKDRVEDIYDSIDGEKKKEDVDITKREVLFRVDIRETYIVSVSGKEDI